MIDRLRQASLFLRMMLVLFATVIAAQLLNWGLLVFMPRPSPQLTALGTIAQVLKTGNTGGTDIKLVSGLTPIDNFVDPSEVATADELAERMNVGTDRVKVVLMRANGGDGPPSPPQEPAGANGWLGWVRTSEPDDGMKRPMPPPRMPVAKPAEMLIGSFEAGLRLSDGSWRVASSASDPYTRWSLEVLAWLMATTVIVTPFAWFFARRLTNPISEFTAAAERLGKNPTGETIAIAGPPEIAAAAQAFNEMQIRLSRYVQDRTSMVAAIAHDLRTPLMRLAFRLRKAPDDIRVDSETDVREIQQMANAALLFVKDISQHDPRHRLALRSLIETVVDHFSDLGADAALEAGDDIEIVADVVGLKRMLTNVIQNAILYGGSARITLGAEGDTAIITVVDNGPGIDPALQDRVFDPFFRVEASRNRATGGTGLGLASARAVARAHGGDVRLANAPGGGLIARILLPR